MTPGVTSMGNGLMDIVMATSALSVCRACKEPIINLMRGRKRIMHVGCRARWNSEKQEFRVPKSKKQIRIEEGGSGRDNLPLEERSGPLFGSQDSGDVR